MRIAVINWSRREVGGIETYLGSILPGLARLGHALAFWHEVDVPAERARLALPEGVSQWCVSDLGAERALAALREWRPDLLYAHGLLTPKLEVETLKIAPAVFLAHSYYGTCISGGKTFKNLVARPCQRRFGWPCLLHYYPHRCGGWNPLTMLREYRRQADRLALLRGYHTILTLSAHMRSEYLRHGFAADRVHTLPPPAPREDDRRPPVAELPPGRAAVDGDSSEGANRSPVPWRLLFAGRMEFLKGGHLLLVALPLVRAALDRPLRVTFAGDGPDRPSWERMARRLRAADPGVVVEFLGWVSGRRLGTLWADCDLAVVPSLWPEPFGMVGPEAALRGVPVAAFAVGGIREWLRDGVNGYLAPGDPPTARGLAEAITKCLHDPATLARLRRGAADTSQRFNLEKHVTALLAVFDDVVRLG